MVSSNKARSLLFYSAWPLGYHNVEAERKAVALARAGFDVVYVAGVGVRNPRIVSLAKTVDLMGRRLRRADPGVERGLRLRTAPLLVAPPRQVGMVRSLNRAWVEAQLRKAVPGWDASLVWARWPTPELVDVLARRRPAGVVYESVDAYHLLPEWTDRWLAIHERAERHLVSLADVVVVPGEVLAGRYRNWGAQVRVVPHGVELFDWSPPVGDRSCPVLGFVGTLDFRLDVGVVREIARARPRWRVRLVGPVQRGFDPRSVADLANVTVEPPVPHARLGEVLAGVDVVVTPYTREHSGAFLTPVKALEALAAGRPVVSAPLESLTPYAEAGGVAFATTAGEFVATVERVLADDSPEAARRRRHIAEANTWERRLAQVVAVAEEVAAAAPAEPRAAADDH